MIASPFRIAGPALEDWREPYRSMDASGSPDSASAVAWRWLEDCAKVLETQPFIGPLSIESMGGTDPCGVTVMYEGTRPIVAATIYRDPMNFAVLIRWVAEGLILHDRPCAICGCRPWEDHGGQCSESW